MVSQVELVSRLLVAAALGSAIGFERERLSWAAGLRTHMLVCVGACLLMIVSAFGFSDILGTPNVTLDPSRIAAQVVSGIGFLGAGAILMRGEIIRGLTTAASLWSVAAIGLAIGGGLYTLAIAATLIILVILAGIKPLEKRYFSSRQRRELRLIADRGTMSLQALSLTLGPSSARVKQFVVQQSEGEPEADEVSVTLARVSDAEFEDVRRRLQKMAGVRTVIDA